MGLFDIFKKSNDSKEKSLSDSIKESGSEDASTANDGRRFTLVVEDNFVLNDNGGIVIVGRVFGKVKVGDAVYIMCPDGKITLSKIDGIEVGPKQLAVKAENQNICMKFENIKNKEDIPKFSVITSIRPQTVVDVDKAVENGQLLGLSMEYGRFCNDPQYMSLFIYVICHAHYIAPVFTNGEQEKNENGTVTLKEGFEMSFPGLKDSKDENKNHLPIFTDWTALRLWKNIFDEKNTPKVVVLRFPDVVTIVNGSMDGLVINPFGPVPILLPKEYIANIVAMEGYQREFGKNPVEQTKKIKVEKETQIMVGVPSPTEEVGMIKDAIVSLAKWDEDIRKGFLLLKIDESGEKAYMAIVDCNEEIANTVFEKIARAVKPYLTSVRYIDLMTLTQYGDRINGMDEKGMIYSDEK